MIVLSWPPSELSPNARSHFRVKAPITKAYRAEAYERAKMNLLTMPSEGGIGLRFDFHPPDKRRRDLDNMLASIKGAIDGIADAHGVNDQRFGFWLSREEPVKGGKIVVTLAGTQF